MIRKILKKQGHTIVAEAETGLGAIEQYKQTMPLGDLYRTQILQLFLKFINGSYIRVS